MPEQHVLHEIDVAAGVDVVRKDHCIGHLVFVDCDSILRVPHDRDDVGDEGDAWDFERCLGHQPYPRLLRAALDRLLVAVVVHL